MARQPRVAVVFLRDEAGRESGTLSQSYKVLKPLSDSDLSKSPPNTCTFSIDQLSDNFSLLTFQDVSTAYWKQVWAAFFCLLLLKEASPPAIWSDSCSAKHLYGGECIHSTFHNMDNNSAGKRADRHLCSRFKSEAKPQAIQSNLSQPAKS